MTRQVSTGALLAIPPLAAALSYCAAAQADDSGPIAPLGFTAALTDCVESIGVALAPTANVQAYVPSEFTLASDGAPVTPMVVRTSRCEGISFGHDISLPVVVVQVGAVIIAPNGTGNIDNYTLWYYTTNLSLTIHLLAAGVNAQFVPDIRYDYNPASSVFGVTVPYPGFPAFAVSGTVVPSSAPSGSFESLWWTGLASGSVALTTNVPVIDIGSADLTLMTAEGGPLAQLFGGGNVTFPVTQQFNFFADATLSASIQPSR